MKLLRYLLERLRPTTAAQVVVDLYDIHGFRGDEPPPGNDELIRLVKDSLIANVGEEEAEKMIRELST